MAAGGSNFMDEVQENLLVCPICMEDFQSPNRLPRMLPCVHCLCGPCLDSLSKDDAVSCPYCREVFPVKGPFPVDTTRMALLDMKQASGKGQKRICTRCPDGAEAVSRCQDCQEDLCEVCDARHRRHGVCRGHALASLLGVPKTSVETNQLAEVCGKHRKKRLKYFCHTCTEPVCSKCAIFFHNGHAMEELQLVLEEERKKVLHWCDQIEAALPSDQLRVDASEASVKILDRRLQRKVEEAEALFANVVTKVMARRVQVLQELRSTILSNRLALEDQRVDDLSLLEEARATVENGRRVASLGFPTELSGFENLEKTFEKLTQKRRAEMKHAPFYSIDKDHMASLTAELEELGAVTRGLPFACPAFSLAASGCGPNSSPVSNTRTLSDESLHGGLQGHDGQADLGTWHFSAGATTSTAASETSCYWQVRCRMTLTVGTASGVFCEMGVASMEGVSRAIDGAQDRRFRSGPCVFHFKYCGGGVAPPPETTGWSSTSRAVHHTVGFLLDRTKGHLHVIDVPSLRPIFREDVDVTEPLWPVLRVMPRESVGAKVTLELQSGQTMDMSDGLVDLLISLLQA